MKHFAILFFSVMVLTTSCRSAHLDARYLNGTEQTFRPDHVFHRMEDRQHGTLVAVQGRLDAPEQVLIIRLIWEGRPGRTPTESHATNATLTWLQFEGEHAIKVYEGAGYINTGGKLSDHQLPLSLLDGHLVLTDITPGTAPRNMQGRIDGWVTSRHDPYRTQHLLSDYMQMAYDRLGYPRAVWLTEAPATASLR